MITQDFRELCLTKLAVNVPLRVRGVNLESDSCIICNESAESVDHALVECASASEVRRLIFGWCGVSPYSFSSVVDLLDFGPTKAPIDTSHLNQKILYPHGMPRVSNKVGLKPNKKIPEPNKFSSTVNFSANLFPKHTIHGTRNTP
ncbi:hypothetical protein L1887_19163 [Cichorium endivia]|nr:hypothetical protein L1887_19163 [Cichorium endivia]